MENPYGSFTEFGDMSLVKIDRLANQIFTIPICSNASISDVILDDNQQIIMVGHLDGNTTLDGVFYADEQFFLSKLDHDGNFIWTQTNSLLNGYYSKLVVDDENTIYTFGLKQWLGESIIQRWDTDGNLVAEESVYHGMISDIALDDGIIITGNGDMNTQFDDLLIPPTQPQTGYLNYVTAYDSSLQALWVPSTPYITFDFHPRIVTTDEGIFFVAIEAQSPASTTVSYTIRKYSNNGSMLDSSIFINNNVSFGNDLELTTDHDRVLTWIRRSAYSPIDTVALYSYDTDLNMENRWFLDGIIPSAEMVSSCYGTFIAGNFFDNSININGEDSLIASGSSNQNFLVKLSSKCINLSNENNSTPKIKIPQRMTLFPNPSYGRIFIHISDVNSSNYRMEIVNLLGQKIDAFPLMTNTINYNASGYVPGIFFTRFWTLPLIRSLRAKK